MHNTYCKYKISTQYITTQYPPCTVILRDNVEGGGKKNTFTRTQKEGEMEGEANGEKVY